MKNQYLTAKTVQNLNNRFYPIGYRVEFHSTNGLYNHWAISTGMFNGEEWFAENQKGVGVRYVRKSELFIQYRVKRFIPFQGSHWEKQEIQRRVRSQIGKPYYILWNNCENFVNWVIEGRSHSPQIKNAVSLTLLAIAIVAMVETSERA
jgi:hypothetical protein